MPAPPAGSAEQRDADRVAIITATLETVDGCRRGERTAVAGHWVVAQLALLTRAIVNHAATNEATAGP